MKSRWEKLFMVIVSVWGVLRILLLRPQVIVFGGDMLGSHPYEPRMTRVYRWLESQNVAYGHLIHAAPHGLVVKHWKQRLRPVVYLEGLRLIHPLLVSWMLKISGAEHLWAIDDYRYWPFVIVAARKARLYSVLFQHGRFTHHQAYLQRSNIPFPDRYVVWNEYWRAKILKLNPVFAQHPDVVRIGGKPSFDATVVVSSSDQAPHNTLKIMVVHEPSAFSDEICALIDCLNDQSNLSLIYKIRSDKPAQAQLLHHGLVERVKKWTVTTEFPSVDLVLGSYSTLLYEVVHMGIPVAVVRMRSTQADDLVDDGLAALIDISGENFLTDLLAAAQVTPEERKRRAQAMEVSTNLEDTLEQLLKNKYPRS